MATITLPTDSTKLFSQVFKNADEFLTGWKSSGLYEEDLVSDEDIKKIYYLMYANWGNSAISGMDVNQWKYRVWSIINQFAPTWAKRVEIQKVLRGLSEEELKEGSKTIQNMASNPSTEPSTNNTEEIITVNSQQVYKNRNSKIGGYARLVELLDEDVTQYFLAKFKPLFAVFVRTRPTLFVVDEEEGE